MAIGTAEKLRTDKRALPDKIIDKQLSRVRRHIRLTDLISGFMTLAAGLLIFLLFVVLVDHWLFDLGTAFRWLALLSLIIGPAWYCATRIAPAMIRGINPAFAAQTIERSEPTLKNSVLNYLLLRRERAALHEVVFQAVQQQAASDVSHVAVEQTVDRSAVIKAGYLLVAVMGVSAAYKILSPKDPVQTVRRIVAPWADIVRPSRVAIDDIQPGDAEVLHGNKLTISAPGPRSQGERSSQTAVLDGRRSADRPRIGDEARFERTAACRGRCAGRRRARAVTFVPDCCR